MSLAPPRPKGPPLNALRAFEAAARLGSFAAAAEELSVTAGAVSQHIRTLEDWAGVRLFRRQAQGVRLTRAGAEVLPALSEGFDALSAGVRALSGFAERPQFRIAALPSVAQLWLQPRLAALRTALPGVRISVHALETPPDLRRSLFDLSLFIRAPGPGLHVIEEDTVFPVCAPELGRRLRHPGDLAGETLLHDESWSEDWPRWLTGAGLDPALGEDGPRYSLYGLAEADAEAGIGVLLGHGPLVASALGSGRLVAPFPDRIATGRVLAAEAPGRIAAGVRAALG